MTFTHLSKENIALIETTEDLFYDLIVDMIKKSAVYADSIGSNKILIDHRKSKLHASIVEIHNIGKNIGDFGVSSGYRGAVVYSQDGDKYEFVEDVIHNWSNGVFRFFDDYDKAVNWLNENG